MNVAALFSGGKDSLFALHVARMYGWDISRVISVVSASDDSFMFHVPNIHVAPLLAEAMAIPYFEVSTAGKKEAELDDLRDALAAAQRDGAEAVITGAVASEYQKTRIERLCHEVGLRSFAPLWHKNHETLLRDMLAAGFTIMIVGAYADGFDKSWLGRIIDDGVLKELIHLNKTHGISITGEGGEYESLVIDAPFFTQRLRIDKTRATWHRDSGTLAVEQAHLEKT